MLLYYKENKKERLDMARIRCGYCGKYYDDGYTGALDNGSPACPECVADEEAEEERKREKAQKSAQKMNEGKES